MVKVEAIRQQTENISLRVKAGFTASCRILVLRMHPNPAEKHQLASEGAGQIGYI
jgi:hypothetical protein